MEAIHHITKAALTDNPHEAMAEIVEADKSLQRMREEVAKEFEAALVKAAEASQPSS